MGAEFTSMTKPELRMPMWVAMRYFAVNVNGHPKVAVNPTMLSLELLIFAY
jgi:hypothetical protein